MNLCNDPVALRQVARYHSQQTRNQYLNARDHHYHRACIDEIKAKLLLLCGSDDIKTPEAWQ